MDIRREKVNGKYVCVTRIGDKAYVGIGKSETLALEDLQYKVDNPKFGMFDMGIQNSHHNSSVATRA